MPEWAGHWIVRITARATTDGLALVRDALVAVGANGWVERAGWLSAAEAVDTDLTLWAVSCADALHAALGVTVRCVGRAITGTRGAGITWILASALADAEGDVTGLTVATL